MKSQTITAANGEPNPMVGSLHKFSDGYGYGARYPTERNRVNVPASIPKYRHPPDSERFLAGTRSVVRAQRDDRSLRRNAEQLFYQTSGEVGSYYYGVEPEFMHLNRKPLEATTRRGHDLFSANKTAGPPAESAATTISKDSPWASSRSNQSARFSDYSMEKRSAYSTPRSQRQGNEHVTQEKLNWTLTNLNPSFERHARYDLMAASQPRKPVQESVWSATGNYQEYLNGKPWMLKLRQDS
eukprot:gene7947-8767_t